MRGCARHRVACVVCGVSSVSHERLRPTPGRGPHRDARRTSGTRWRQRRGCFVFTYCAKSRRRAPLARPRAHSGGATKSPTLALTVVSPLLASPLHTTPLTTRVLYGSGTMAHCTLHTTPAATAFYTHGIHRPAPRPLAWRQLCTFRAPARSARCTSVASFRLRLNRPSHHRPDRWRPQSSRGRRRTAVSRVGWHPRRSAYKREETPLKAAGGSGPAVYRICRRWSSIRAATWRAGRTCEAGARSSGLDQSAPVSNLGCSRAPQAGCSLANELHHAVSPCKQRHLSTPAAVAEIGNADYLAL